MLRPLDEAGSVSGLSAYTVDALDNLDFLTGSLSPVIASVAVTQQIPSNCTHT